MARDDVDEEAFIYEYLGMEPGEEMVSDNAHDRYVAAFRALDNGDIVIPPGWRPGRPTRPGAPIGETGQASSEPGLVGKIIGCAILLGLIIWGVLALVG